MAIVEGKSAPDFTLPSTTGGEVRLADYKGRQAVVLYFYPRDNTPGCTLEARDFAERYAAFKKAGAEVLGVSPDALKSHERFQTKCGLPFPLLSDPEHKALEQYGAWGQKILYGKKSIGVIRSTVLIDKEGRIARIWPKVSVKGHAEEVLDAVLKANNGSGE